MKDHDTVVVVDGKKKIAKGATDEGRPHAASCSGCRREGVCVGCAEPTSMMTGRCTSGACPSCCWKIHKHPTG